MSNANFDVGIDGIELLNKCVVDLWSVARCQKCH